MGTAITLIFAFTEGAFETAIKEVRLQKIVSLPAYLKATAKETTCNPRCSSPVKHAHTHFIIRWYLNATYCLSCLNLLITLDAI